MERGAKILQAHGKVATMHPKLLSGLNRSQLGNSEPGKSFKSFCFWQTLEDPDGAALRRELLRSPNSNMQFEGAP